MKNKREIIFLYEIWQQIKHTPEASAILVHQSRLYSQVGGRGLCLHPSLLSTAELSVPSLSTSVLVSFSYHLHYHLFLVSLPRTLTTRLRRRRDILIITIFFLFAVVAKIGSGVCYSDTYIVPRVSAKTTRYLTSS